MRAVAQEALGAYDSFTSINAPAEATTLPRHSIDLITAAQSFHWFNQQKAKTELQRILQPGGTVVLIWNTRDQSSPFMRVCEDIINEYCIERDSVVHTKTASQTVIENLIAPHPVKTHTMPNSQSFDYPALRGRLLSSSYSPIEEHPSHQPMLTDLKQAFDDHHHNGQVEFRYMTEVFWGKL